MNTLGEFTLSTPDHFHALSVEDKELLSIVMDELMYITASPSGDLMYNIRGVEVINEDDEPTITLTGIWVLPEQQVEYLHTGGSPEASGFVKSESFDEIEDILNPSTYDVVDDDPTTEDMVVDD